MSVQFDAGRKENVVRWRRDGRHRKRRFKNPAESVRLREDGGWRPPPSVGTGGFFEKEARLAQLEAQLAAVRLRGRRGLRNTTKHGAAGRPNMRKEPGGGDRAA